MIHPTYLAVLGMGLLHGLEPGHGWPVAALYALRRPHKYLSAWLAALIIAGAHFVSSIAVVVVYVLGRQFTDFSAPWIKYLVAGTLWFLAFRMWRSHGHHHDHDAPPPSLWGLAGFAFLLGFAHEEEFALLALVVGGVNPWVLMITYATAVTISIITVTLLAVKAYEWAHHLTHRMEPYLPKVTAVALAVIACLMLWG